VAYDTAARPQTTTSAYGAQTVYTYSAAGPQIVATTNNHWVKTYLDGLGRVAKIEKGNGSSTPSSTEIVHDAVGATPIGKVISRSMPHAPGATAYFNVSTYDVIGRLTSRKRPDGSSTYTYSYAGNVATVTDPARKWKKFTADAFSQLIQVEEPTPNSSNEPNHISLYTYDTFGHLTQARMDRTIRFARRTGPGYTTRRHSC